MRCSLVRVVGILIGVSAFSFAGVWAYLSYYYLNTCPMEPEPIVERTFPLLVHGTTVYLNTKERMLIGVSGWGMAQGRRIKIEHCGGQ